MPGKQWLRASIPSRGHSEPSQPEDACPLAQWHLKEAGGNGLVITGQQQVVHKHPEERLRAARRGPRVLQQPVELEQEPSCREVQNTAGLRQGRSGTSMPTLGPRDPGRPEVGRARTSLGDNAISPASWTPCQSTATFGPCGHTGQLVGQRGLGTDTRKPWVCWYPHCAAGPVAP